MRTTSGVAGEPDQLEGLPAVTGLTDDGEVRLGVQDQRADPGGTRLVVDDEHPRRAHGDARSVAVAARAPIAKPPTGVRHLQLSTPAR